MKRKPPTFIPVIHIRAREKDYGIRHAIEQVIIAVAAGCTGVMLIDHASTGSEHALRCCYDGVREHFTDLWIGLNFLGWTTDGVLRQCLPPDVDGIWTDYPESVSSGQPAQFLSDRYRLGHLLKAYGAGEDWAFMASVAFKYVNEAEDPETAIKNAIQYSPQMIVTSGNATGEPPTVEKIAALRRALLDRWGASNGPFIPGLAIASGISIDNINSFLPYADHFLVASSIGRNFHNFDADKVAALAERINTYKP